MHSQHIRDGALPLATLTLSNGVVIQEYKTGPDETTAIVSGESRVMTEEEWIEYCSIVRTRLIDREKNSPWKRCNRCKGFHNSHGYCG